jgi:hypothetical protein
MNALPVIKSIGPPPERHCERMAVEFARWLVAQEHRYYPAWADALDTRNDGNPKGQMKMVERLAKAAGPMLLDNSLAPGKRRKYTLALHRLIGWDKGGMIEIGAPIPAAPWLAVIVEQIVCSHAAIDQNYTVTALISQHAIARLAERCGARDPLDVIEIARTMSLAIIKRLKKTYRDEMPLGGWRVPFKGGIAIVRFDEASGNPLVTTVLPPTENVQTRT